MYRGLGGTWHLWIAELRPGQAYGYRVHGPYDPGRGQRFNPAKLLADPYARAVAGDMVWDAALIVDRRKSGRHSEGPCEIDSAPFAPRSLVVDSRFDWGGGESSPRTPWRETVIYECHVRGLSQLHPEVPAVDRGRYLGLAHDSVIDHLRRLGVTAVELLPVQQFVSEPHLQQRESTNYWGYNTLAWLAPHSGYASSDYGRQVFEFKEMVRRLHAAGLEVLLDIVFNHTAEGDAHGPTLGLRGLGDSLYYRQSAGGAYENFSGCGNTLDVRRAPARRLVLDALRYWVEEMHVDGFRLDLAPVLGRTDPAFDPAAPFFEEILTDPLLSGVKWIAEPWDVGPGGYQLGRFPKPFAEWNDRFRDSARTTWRGDPGTLPELIRRLEGSADLFAPDRGPHASVNLVVSHDGFTLRDWSRYDHRHNEANGEHNHDGHAHTLSRNWGVEGATTEDPIIALRERARRNLAAMLGLARGVPMISHGDELGRSQNGNNNAYCQDNATTWIDWRLTPADDSFLAFMRRLFAVRRSLLSWLHPESGSPQRRWTWLTSAGERPADATTAEADASLGAVLGLMAEDAGGATPRCLLWLNTGAEACRVSAPFVDRGWRVALCSFEPAPGSPVGEVELPPWSLLLLSPDLLLSPEKPAARAVPEEKKAQ